MNIYKSLYVFGVDEEFFEDNKSALVYARALLLFPIGKTHNTCKTILVY